MAFHEIKIGSKNFTLAPKYIKGPETAASTGDYGFLLFQYDADDSSICKLYSPGPWDLPSIKYSSGNIDIDCKILPNSDGTNSVGASNQKFNAMYATTFHGDLSGTSTNATNVNVVTSSENTNYPLVFTTSVTAGNKVLATDTANSLYYNPSTNVLTTTTFSGNLSGTATNATYINVAAANTTDASYYIQFVNGTTGNRKSYTDTTLKYNPKTNTLTTTRFSGTATNATYINVAAANTTDASYYIQFVNGPTGNKKSYTDTNLHYNPSTNVLTTTQVNANLNGAVQTTSTSTSASYYISFVNGSGTAMRYSYVNSGFYYNPSTNGVTATKFTGSLDGNATSASTVLLTTQTAAGDYPIIYGPTNSVTSTGTKSVYVDANLTFNPNTNILTVPKIKYTSTAQQWIGGKTLENNAFYPSNNFTTTAFFPILAAKTSGENVISLGGLGDQYGFFGYKKDTTENKTDWHFKWDSNNGNTYVTGKIYGTATHADNINVSAATANATYYVSFVNGTSGARIPYTDSGLYYNPSTNELSAGGGFYERSDARLKDFQEDIEVNFSYLHSIPKKYYSWKDDATYTRHIGTSAQEVQKYYPELVNIDETGYLTMNYDKLSVVALKAIDVLHEEVTELKKENAELKERLARLEELILNNR